MTYIKNKQIILLIIIIFSFRAELFSQDNTLYNMRAIPQSTLINPAYQHKCRFHLGLPAISNIMIDVTHTGFNFNDFIHYGSGSKADSLIMDFDGVLSKLHKSNYLKVENQITILALGFWIRDFHITLDITNNTHVRFGYPKDILGIKDGNGAYIGADNPIDLSGFDVFAINYIETAIGVSKELFKGLTVGTKIKFLRGLGNIESRKTDLTITTDADNFAITTSADMLINFTAPVNIKKKDDGTIDNIEMKAVEDLSTSDFKNRGIAFDFGAIYELTDKISFSASIIDFGFINWKNNINNLSLKGSYTFSGININNIDSIGEGFGEMTDSLENKFKSSSSNDKYRTWLDTKIYLGANYKLTKKIDFGFLYKSFFYDRKIHQSLTLSANTNFTKWFALSFNYSMMNYSYNNLGLGFGIKLGFFQWYLLTDNLSVALWPKKSKTVNLRTGINFVFGCKQQIDLPQTF